MEINTASGVPIWRQLADAITAQINAGELKIGDRVPSVRELADEWDVAVSSASAALNELRSQGIVKTARGRGTFVAARPMLFRLGNRRYHLDDDVSPTTRDLVGQGSPTSLTGVASVDSAPPHIAERLSISPGDPVSRVDYLWTDDHGPIQRSTQYEPLALTRGTAIEVPPESGYPQVITRFASIGHMVAKVTEQVYSRMPLASESAELHIGEAVPVLFIARTHYTQQAPVETAEITIRGDRMAISIEHAVTKESAK